MGPALDFINSRSSQTDLIRGQNASGVWQKFEYDAAGRVFKVKDDSNNVIETYTYGASREKLIVVGPSDTTYYVWGGDSITCEYLLKSGIPRYEKSYIKAGSRLLMTSTRASASTEVKEFHHPDRLGTQLVTDSGAGTSYRQTTFPFGTSITAETTGNSNQVFTSYDRSAATGLDYAVNRTYSSGQSRFTQVDPIGMAAANIGNPQSNNLYAYTQNMPTDFVDPSGLNANAGFYVCFDIVSSGHWSNDPSSSVVSTRTVCFTFGGGASSGGQTFSGGSVGGNGAANGPKCPPKNHAKTFYSYPQQLETYARAVQLTQDHNREVGGWVYQLRSGVLKAVIKDLNDPRDKPDEIALGQPPAVPGAKVVGTFHVHRGRSGGIDSYPSGYEYEKDGYLHSAADYAINRGQKVPGLLLSRAPGGGESHVTYGPDRGYMWEGVPNGCK